MWSRVVLCGWVIVTSSCGCSQSTSDSTSAVPPSAVPQAEPATTVHSQAGETVETASANNASAEPSAPAAVPSIPDWQKDITLQFMDWPQTQELIASLKGKVVVVDVWSTACEPCLREFPNLVQLQKEHSEEIVCIGLNCDFAGVRKKPPEFYRDRVMQILKDKEARIINVMCTIPADELFVALKIDSIPAAFVNDREGQLVARFDNTSTENGEFTYRDQVMPAIEPLLQAAATSTLP